MSDAVQLSPDAQAALDVLSSQLVVLDERGVIAAANRGWLGFARANGVMTDAWGVGADYLAVCAPAARVADGSGRDARAAMAAVLSGEVEVLELEFPMHVPADQRWFSLRARPFHADGVTRRIAALENVSARTRAQREAAQLATAVQTSMDGVAIIGADGLLSYANEAYAALFGYDRPDHLLGRSWREVYEPQELVRFDQTILPVFRVLGQWRGESNGLRRDGSTFPQEISLTRLAGEGIVCVVRDITRAKRRETALRESEMRFRSIAEAATDALILTDGSGNITFWNGGAQQMYGYAQDEVLGHPYTILIPERFRESHLRALRDAPSPSESPWVGRSSEWLGLRKDGTEFPLELSIGHVMTERGPSYSAIVRDVTDRKRAEREVRLLASLSLLISDAGDLDAALFVTLQHICSVTGWAYGEVWLPDPAGSALIRSPVWYARVDGLAEFAMRSEAYTVRRGEGLEGQAWSAGDAIYLPDVHASPLFARAAIAGDAGVRSCVAIPIMTGDDLAAALVFLMREPSPGDERFVELVSAVVTQLGAVIERKRAEAALRASEAHLRAATDGTPDAFYVLQAIRDDEGQVTDFEFVDLNARGEELLGCLRAHAIGRRFGMVMTTQRSGALFERYARVLETGVPLEEEFEIGGPSASSSWMRHQVVPLPDGVAVSSRDVTERKRIEHALFHEREFLRTLLENLTNGIIACDAEGRITLYNRATRELLPGLAAVAGDSAAVDEPTLFAADGVTALEPAERPLARALRGETVRDLEVVVRSTEDVPASLLVSGDALYDAEGRKRGAVIVLNNVTQQKQAEASLRELLLVDELTGLYNRRGFFTLAVQQIKVARRGRRRLHLLYIDMDGFKSINDTHGHSEGDAALCAAAGVLRETFREADILGRLGGDEFVVLAVEGDHQSPSAVIGRLLDQLQMHNKASDRPYALSFSVGFAAFDPSSPETLDALMARADEMLYRNKRSREVRRGEPA